MRLLETLLVAVCMGCLPACFGFGAPSVVHPNLMTASEHFDALAVSDALEALIAEGKDTSADLNYAYKIIREHEQNTAAYAFARAAVTGRMVQRKGLLAADLVGDVERWARRSRELDPNFRDGAATRMLGTLYVLAPAALLRYGDSEAGLEMLEELVKKRPDILENHLRVAEAYISLGDPAPAQPHLCRVMLARNKLRRDDQKLLAQLLSDFGPISCGSPAPQPDGLAEYERPAIGRHAIPSAL